MFVIGNFILAVARIVDIILFFMYWMILIRALLSWVNPDPYNPIVQFLNRATEPILKPIRKIMPPMGVDLSPILAFFLIIFLQIFLVASLRDLGHNIKRSSSRSNAPVIEYAVPEEKTTGEQEPLF